MNTIKSTINDTVICVEYDNYTNTIDIQVGNKHGFRFINLDYKKTELLIDLLNEVKNNIE